MTRQTAIFPGRYTQGAGALAELPAAVARLGSRTFVIAGATARRELLPTLELPHTPGAFAGECSDQEIERLSTLGQGCDVVVAMGGGKVIDTGKAVAHQLGAASVVVPTIASTDAPCSAVAVIYTPEGAFKRYLFLPRNPDLVLVDTRVIARAPVRFLVAGMGDALSTWFEADACRRTLSENQCGGLATGAALALARLCYETLLEHGLKARLSCEAGAVTPALEQIVEANTLLSGLGFESAGLASAHSIHNGLTRLEATHAFYHGEKVAVGVQAGLFLADRPGALIAEVYSFCEAVGLPTTLGQLGLENPDLAAVAEAACAPGETIHHEAGRMTPERVADALLAADAYGRSRIGKF